MIRPLPIPNHIAAGPQPADALWRAAHTSFRCHIERSYADDSDPVVKVILKAATSPTALLDSPLAARAVVNAADTLPNCAASGLRGRGLKLTFDNASSIWLPGRSTVAADLGGFTSEGAPIRVAQDDLSGGIILAPLKFCVIVVLSHELMQNSNAPIVIKARLSDSWRLAWDKALFSSAAAVEGLSPAGIFNDVTPIAATAGGGSGAMAGDLKLLIAALVAAGAGADPLIIASPELAMAILLMAGSKFNTPVLASSAMVAGSIAMVEAGSFASAFSPVPEFSISDSATLHMEGATPLPFNSVETGAAVPMISLFQHGANALKMRLKCSWGMRSPGHVQLITGATW